MESALVASIGVVLAVLMIVFAMRFGKHFFKLFSIIMLLGFLILLIYMGFMVEDATDLKEGLEYQNNLFVLEKDGNIISALQLNELSKITGADIYVRRLANKSTQEIRDKGNLELESEETTFSDLSNDKILSLNSMYTAGDYDGMLNDYYKIFIFNYSLFEQHKGKTVDLGYYQITIEDCLALLESADPFNEMVRRIALNSQEIPNDVAARLSIYQSNFKSMIFMLMMAEMLEGGERDTTQVFMMLKSKQLTIYPETMSVQFMSGMSTGTMDYIFQQIIEQRENE